MIAAGVACRALTRVFAGRPPRDGLRNCTFSASPGEIVGVIGPHGSGKTTLLRLLAGTLRPTTGEACIAGHAAGSVGARLMLGYASDPPLAPGEFTGLEWLQYLASHYAARPLHRQVLVRFALECGALEHEATRRIAEYSHDLTQRLALAAAAMTGRAVVLLDEVLTGLDPLVARDLGAAVLKLATAGRVVLMASHDLSTIERLATRVLVLWLGRVIADVQTATLLSERVAELSLRGEALSHADFLRVSYRGAARTGTGVAIPLTGGLTVEQILAECRDRHIAVAGSRLRYRTLEDLLLAAAVADVEASAQRC